MGDPERLLSRISDSNDFERELLGSIKRVDPPAGAQAEGWARLSAQLAAVAVVGTAAHGSAAAASALAGAAPAAAKVGLLPAALQLVTSKVAVALAISAVAAGASAVWLHESQKSSMPPPASTPSGHATGLISGQLSAALPAAPDPALQLIPDSDPSKQSATADQHRRDMLSAESALLTQARAELRRGDAHAAEQLLSTLHSKFPKGMLGQEREVLAIEVLSARGNKEAARRRARAFIATYPESPHSAQLSRYADAP